LLFAAQVAQVVSEYCCGDPEHDRDLEQETGRDLAPEQLGDERDQVADQDERGDEQREVGQPFADRRPALLRIVRAAAADDARDEQEHRERDDQRAVAFRIHADERP
jgi:hypothetical protein